MIKQINGLTINIREGVNDDFIYDEIFKKNVYKSFPLKSEDIVLELGGHIGLFALYAHNKVKEIVSFEPENGNADMYAKNISENNIKNCKLMRYAVVGNDDKERTFYMNKKYCSNTLFKSRDKKTEVKVNCMNINDIIKLNNFNKIKMDIEGAEYEIFKNIKSFEEVETIIFELHLNTLKDFTLEKYNEILNILKQNNFKYIKMISRQLFFTTVLVLASKKEIKNIKRKSLFED